MKTVLVTGGSGFIGSHVLQELLAEGVKVRCLVQAGVTDENLRGLDIERVTGDLLNASSLRDAVDGVDTVIHMAALYKFWMLDSAMMYRVNVEGTVALIAAAKEAGVKRFVHCSSFSTVGEAPGLELADEATLFNHWSTADHYVMSKYMSELEALKQNSPDFPVVVINPAFPFGANDVAPTPTGTLIQRLAYGQSPIVLEGGLNCVDVRDVAKGAVLAAKRGRPGERYILGNENLTYKQLGDRVCRMAGQKEPRWTVPVGPLARLGAINEWISNNITKKEPLLVDRGLRFTGGRFLYCSVDKAREELGYDPQPVDDGLALAVKWFLDRK